MALRRRGTTLRRAVRLRLRAIRGSVDRLCRRRESRATGPDSAVDMSSFCIRRHRLRRRLGRSAGGWMVWMSRPAGANVIFVDVHRAA